MCLVGLGGLDAEGRVRGAGGQVRQVESTQLTNDICHVHHYVRVLERGGGGKGGGGKGGEGREEGGREEGEGRRGEGRRGGQRV